jgi:hypothetical protein
MDMNDTGNRVIAGIVAVLLIIGAWYLGTIFKSGPLMGTHATSTATTSGSAAGNTSGTGSITGTVTSPNSGGTVTVGGEAVSVGDQPAGSFVSVTSVSVAKTGWVAVRDASGHVLGAARVEAGTHEAVQVPLLRNIAAGQKYQVLLYTDDGDKKFDLHKDTLVMNADGTVAGASFSALNGD